MELPAKLDPVHELVRLGVAVLQQGVDAQHLREFLAELTALGGHEWSHAVLDFTRELENSPEDLAPHQLALRLCDRAKTIWRVEESG